MGFLDEIKEIDPLRPSQPKGGFLNNVRDQTPTERKVQQYGYEAEKAKLEEERLNRTGRLIIDTVKGIPNTANEGAKSVLETADSFVKHTMDIYRETPMLLWNDIEESAKDMGQGEIKGTFKAGGRTAYHVANAVFAPISAAIGSILEKTGGQKLLDKTGEVIADKSGITDLPAFQRFAMEHPNAAEDFNGIMMLLMAKFETGEIRNPKELYNAVNKFADDIVYKAQPTKITPKSETPGEVKVKVNTPESRYKEYLDSQGYEPYIPDGKLPTIDMGKPASESFPTIQVGESVKVTRTKNGEWTYEPIKETPVINTPKAEARPSPYAEASPVFDKAPVTEIPKGNKPSKQAEDIAKTLDQEFDIHVSPDDLAQYKTKEGFMADQAQRAIDFIKTDSQKAMDVAMGKGNAPRGLTNESVYATMKKIAIQAGDTDTLIALAKSKVATEASIKGQEIKSLDVLDPNMTDPVKILQDINKSYETAFEKRTRKKSSEVKNETIKEIKTEIRKKAPSKADWNDFIEKIKCSY